MIRSQIARAVPPVRLQLASYKDDFTLVSGTLNGRTIPGLVQYTAVLDSGNSGGTINALNVTTSGKGTVLGTSAYGHTHGYSTSMVGSNNYAVDRILGGGILEFDIAAAGTAVTRWSITSTLNTYFIVATVVAGTTVLSTNLTAENAQAGDIIEARRVTIAGSDYGEVRINGRIIMPSSGYSSASVTGSIGGYISNCSSSGQIITATTQQGVINAGDVVVVDYLSVYQGTIAAFGTNGTTGTGANAGGTYYVTPAPGVTLPVLASSAVLIYSNILNVTAVASGALAAPMTIACTLATYHEISGQLSGTTGGIGRYSLTGVPRSQTPIAGIIGTYGRIPLGAVAANGFQGFSGGNTAAIDSHEVGDMTRVSRIVITQSGRVRSLETNGTLIVRGTFEYTGNIPISLKSEIHLGSDNSILAGTAGQTVTFTLNTANKTGTFQLVAFTPANTSTQYFARIYSTGMAVDGNGGPTIISAETGFFTAGLVVLTMGQSLMALADTSTTTTAWPTPVPTAWFQGAAIYHPYAQGNNAIVGTNTGPIAFIDTILPAFGSQVITYVSTGIGSTCVYDRAPGSNGGPNGPQYDAAVRVLNNHGMKVSLAIHNDGQRDTGVTAIPVYAAKFATVHPSIASISGTALPYPVFVIPLEAVLAGSDPLCETLRRYQACELLATDSRYHCAGFIMDLQHKLSGTDTYHLIDEDFGEMMRRTGCAVQTSVNSTTYPCSHNGPSLASFTKTDAQTLVVMFNLAGFTGMVASAGLGTNGMTDQWNGGMRFGTAVGSSAGVTKSDGVTVVNTITTEVYPTGCTVGAVSGTQVPVTFTFAAGTFSAATPHVSGPYGANPFNRTNNSTVNGSFASQASMLQGTIGSEKNVAIMPYWNLATGNDYL